MSICVVLNEIWEVTMKMESGMCSIWHSGDRVGLMPQTWGSVVMRSVFEEVCVVKVPDMFRNWTIGGMEGLFETVWVPQNSRFVNNTHSTLDCRWSYRQPSVIANVCCVFCFSKSQIWIWKMFEVLQTHHVNQKKLFSWFLQLIFFFFFGT